MSDIFGYRRVTPEMKSKFFNKQFGEFVYISIEDNDWYNKAKITTYLRAGFFTHAPSYFSDLEQVKTIIKNLKKAKKVLLTKKIDKDVVIGKNVKVVLSYSGTPMIILTNENPNASQLDWDAYKLTNLDTMIRNFNKAVKFVEDTVKKSRRIITNVYERVDQ